MQNHLDRSLTQALKFRCIGPPRGGRVLAVAGHPTEQSTFYFGACAGGIWKSDDGGQYWQNISDGYLNSAAVGASSVPTPAGQTRWLQSFSPSLASRWQAQLGIRYSFN